MAVKHIESTTQTSSYAARHCLTGVVVVGHAATCAFAGATEAALLAQDNTEEK